MVDRAPRLIDVIRKLDLLDGRRDGAYGGDFSLLTSETTVGACSQVASAPGCQGKGGACGATAHFKTPQRRWIDVDCRRLARMLDALGEMAVRMPRFRPLFEALTHLKRPSEMVDPRLLSYGDFFAFLVVDFMISSLLAGTSTTDQSLLSMFESAPLRNYNAAIQIYGLMLRRPEFQERAVVTHGAGLMVFAALGKRYGFSIKPFTPKKPLKGIKPE